MNLGFKRGDDDENVKRNYELICSAADLDAEGLVFNTQVHSDTIVNIQSSNEKMGLSGLKKPKLADGFITNVKGIVLTCFYADCVPILLYDPHKEVIGAIHSGWRSTLLKISQKAIINMIESYGCSPENIIAVIGPSICQDHFEVGLDVAEEFNNKFNLSEGLFKKKGDKFHIDLWGLNKSILIEAGLKESNIEVAQICTYCNEEKFFSHRRDGDKRGNHTAFIELKGGK